MTRLPTRSTASVPHDEVHATRRIGWLRAAVLGANDGIVSTSSLVVGVAAAGASRSAVITAGVAGLVGGAMSMATGEYISVSSQADSERADIATERQELASDPASELRELAGIYQSRGLDADLAQQVAEQLTARDALAAHQRDELGISGHSPPRPIQAATSSAAAFTVGAIIPLVAAIVASTSWRVAAVAVTALACLGLLGYLSAWAGNAPPSRAIARITLLSAAAMALTALIGVAVGRAV